jgi:hypothetical protein
MGEQLTTTASHRPRWPAILAVCVLVTGVLAWRLLASRDAVRWLLWSGTYKSEVLAQPAPPNGELKHIEWDGWGFAGLDNTVFLVFDPTDALAAAARSEASGKFPGLPCEVVWVHRLERQWYTARFYTNTYWNFCGDCSDRSSRTEVSVGRP